MQTDNSAAAPDDLRCRALAQELDKKLVCGICLEMVREDAVEAVCPGRHTFCFSCILQYVGATDEATRCPSCRGGKCAVTAAPFLAQAAKVFRGEEGEEEDSLAVYQAAAAGTLRDLHPGMFHAGRFVICPEQMRTFLRFRRHVARYDVRRYTAAAPPPPRYAAVNIDWDTRAFVVSFHATRGDAHAIVVAAPRIFGASFIVKISAPLDIAADTRRVVYQHRPVNLSLDVGLSWFLCTTFPEGEPLVENVYIQLCESAEVPTQH